MRVKNSNNYMDKIEQIFEKRRFTLINIDKKL